MSKKSREPRLDTQALASELRATGDPFRSGNFGESLRAVYLAADLSPVRVYDRDSMRLMMRFVLSFYRGTLKGPTGWEVAAYWSELSRGRFRERLKSLALLNDADDEKRAAVLRETHVNHLRYLLISCVAARTLAQEPVPASICDHVLYDEALVAEADALIAAYQQEIMHT